MRQCLAARGARACLAGNPPARYGRSSQRSMEATMSTEDDEFRATDSGLFGFLADHDDDDVPFKPFGVVGYGHMTGVLGFSGEAHPEGPIQQNSYSFDAGVEGGSVQFTGVAGVSPNLVGVSGHVEQRGQMP